MNLIKSAWAQLPTVGKVVLIIVLGGVLVSAMYYGMLEQVTEWLNSF